MLVGVCLQLERIVPVGDVMTMTPRPGPQIEKTVQKPMENEQQLDLLQEMDLFMTYESYFIPCLFGDPDENKKRKPCVIVEDSLSGIDLERQHISKT